MASNEELDRVPANEQSINVHVHHNGRPTEFADLNDDCLIEICVRLPWNDLCAFADTNKRMREAALESFKLRKNKSIAFRAWFAYLHYDRGVSATKNKALFFRALRLFIDLGVEVELYGEVNSRICDYLARVYGGTLKSLSIRGGHDGGAEFAQNCVHVHRLFANLTKLEIEEARDQLPLGRCESLEHLIMINACFLDADLASTFPRLQSLRAISVNATFIYNHPQLKEVDISHGFPQVVDALIDLPELQPLKVGGFNLRDGNWQRLDEFRHLKHLDLGSIYGGGVGNILRNADAMIQSLEVLKVQYSRLVQPDWSEFALLKALRELQVTYQGPANDLTAGIELFVERAQSIHLRTVIIHCEFHGLFDIEARNRVDAICKQRGILLTLKGRIIPSKGQKLSIRSFDEVIVSNDCLWNPRIHNGRIILGKRV